VDFAHAFEANIVNVKNQYKQHITLVFLQRFMFS